MIYLTPEVIKNGQDLGRSMLGREYKLGAKWNIDDDNPKGCVDCSGFVRWFVHKVCGIVLPDGSYNQVKVCERLPEEQQDNPPFLSLGFYTPDGSNIDHVIVAFDEENVIEARGEPYNKVILRPILKWRRQRGFLGFHSIKTP